MSALRTAQILASAFGLVMLAACTREQPVTYADVKPVFEQYCVSCHQPGRPGYEESGFDMTGYDAVMKGTRFGAVVLPGEPRTSTLLMLLEGRADPSIKMPHGVAPAPSEAEIETIREWVAQGARP
jgi:mono/diheme cytochrome c family protein